MTNHGLPERAGPIGVMLAEHEQGRAYSRALREAARQLAAGDDTARGTVLRHARDYIMLLRQHIAKEDNVLFPMAANLIPPAEQTSLAEDFERIEHEETGEGIHEKYLALIEALEKEAIS
jgi:hemerythrin-like domain-containing protein